MHALKCERLCEGIDLLLNGSYGIACNIIRYSTDVCSTNMCITHCKRIIQYEI